MVRDYFVFAVMGHAHWISEKGTAMITLSCEEVRREISNYLDDDMSPRMRRLLEVPPGAVPQVCGVAGQHAQCACLAGPTSTDSKMPAGFSLRMR